MVGYKSEDTRVVVSLTDSGGQSFIVKLQVKADQLKVVATDKTTAEKWRCAHDRKFIEGLTSKTGNFKGFEVFSVMLRAGLLRTNEAVWVELLSHEDLRERRRKVNGRSREQVGRSSESTERQGVGAKSRKYLILVYQAEFDRIHYPLAMEYCGGPRPEVLLAQIKKLENELNQAKGQLATKRECSTTSLEEVDELRKLVSELNEENKQLIERIAELEHELKDGPECWGKKKEDDERLRRERLGFLDRIYRLEIENRKLTSLLSGRGLWGRRSRGGSRTRGSGERRRSLSLESLISLVGQGRSPSVTSCRASKGRPSPSPTHRARSPTPKATLTRSSNKRL